MAEGITIDWTPIIWVAGVVAAMISSLLTWIGFLIYADKKQSRINYANHTIAIETQQKEIHELAVTTSRAIAVIEANTENNTKLIDLMMSKKRK